MMKRHRLYEDKLPTKLPIVLSPKLVNEMDVIYDYNQDNHNDLYQWYSYIDNVQNCVSNRVIAWDYNCKHIRFPNGTFFIRDFGYNVGYTIKTNKQNQTYVYVFMMNLKPEEFGLKVPTKLGENKQICKLPKRICLTESQLKYIIKETIIRILLSA